MAAPQDQTILITGASGFVGAHVTNSFLTRGYKVKAAVRTQKSADGIKKAHAKYVDQLSFTTIGDITKDGAFDEAVKDVDGVVHLASPFVLNVQDNETELLNPAIKGTTEILKAVMNHNPKVKRVVICSSFSSLLDLSKGKWPEHTYNESDWNPVTWDEAKVGDGPTAYSASKVFAEQAAWDFVKEKKPNFTLSVICPPMVYGPSLHEPASVRELNTSSADIYRVTNGSEKDIPQTVFFAFVDSRDVGEAHAKAYEAEKSGRFYIASGNFEFQQIADIINKDFPERKHLTPVGNPGTTPEAPYYKIDHSFAEKELGLKFRDLQTTIHDMVVGFKEIEARGGI